MSSMRYWESTSNDDYLDHLKKMEKAPTMHPDIPLYPNAYCVFKNKFNSPFKLVILHAKPTPASVIGLAVGPGSVEAFSAIESNLKKIAARVVEKAKEICKEKSVNDVVVEIVEGDARHVLCEAVEKLHASVLVVGCHGYGVIKRTVLGSVSDYCAHHAHCSVMIVKKPKT